MTITTSVGINDSIFAAENFFPNDLNDEIRIDQLSVSLLQIFCRDLIDSGVEPLRAGALARGADYFLREFAIDHCRDNIFSLPQGRVRSFAGNWYIIKTIEPNRSELSEILQGVEEFYRYCFDKGRITASAFQEISTDCAQLDYYEERINSFWEMTSDGYQGWDAACPINGTKI